MLRNLTLDLCSHECNSFTSVCSTSIEVVLFALIMALCQTDTALFYCS